MADIFSHHFDPRARRAWLLTGAFLTVVVAATIWPESEAIFSIMSLGMLFIAGSAFWAVTKWKRRPRAAWAAIGSALFLFIAAAYLREAYGTFGVLDDSRSIVPDLVAITGYFVLGFGVVRLLLTRRRLLPGAFESFLDAGMAGLAALSLAWVFISAPALQQHHLPPQFTAALAAYQPLSIALAALTAQLAFERRAGRPKPAFFAFFTAMVALVVGDVAFTLADARLISPPLGLLNLPYALAFAAGIPLIWHPSADDFAHPIPLSEAKSAKLRLPLVGLALVLPTAVAALRPLNTVTDRRIFAVISVSLACVAMLRVIRAVSAQARTEAVLRYQATHDSLTGLSNRPSAIEHLDERLALMRDTGEPVAVLFLDLDRFKLVNDTYGHGMGDELLVTVAERLRTLPVPTSLTARIGGDEFVVSLSGMTNLSHAVICADQVRDALSSPVEIDGVELPASVSIGVAFADGTDRELSGEEMLRDADTAMYQAKAAGRDAVVVFDAAMRDQASRRLELETDLRHAIDRGELEVVYQPIVALPSEQISGFEALVRWHHPVLGTVSPGEFIPIAEETGMIVGLGDWVLEQALEQLAHLHRTVPGGLNLTMAVNVSTRQLLDDRLVGRVAELLERSGVPDGRLYLEVTESVLMEDPETLEVVLRDLRETGVRLSIDDFGTGYSSLAYLRRFPFDRVKIDRAFVDGLDRAPASERNLVIAIVAMATALNLDTVAEGVEQAGEAQTLSTMGCTGAQGYYFWRPVSANQLGAAIIRLGLANGSKQVVPSAR